MEPGQSGQNNPVARQASSSTLPSVVPEQPAASTSAQPQPQAQAQFAFGQTGPYVYGYHPGYTYYSQPPQNQGAPTASVSQPHTPSEQNGLKRAYGFGDNTGEVAILEPSQKRPRHCCKCGSQDCKGKGGRMHCNKPCQDCGKGDCKGRNSRRPDKVCSEAWN